jgi:hypothetical protein
MKDALAPRLVLQHPKGHIELVVTHPTGLVPEWNASRTDYAITFIPASRASTLYERIIDAPSKKVTLILQHHFKLHRHEVPLLVRRPAQRTFEVRNDIHVLAALVAAGLDPVPVMVHVDDAAEV